MTGLAPKYRPSSTGCGVRPGPKSLRQRLGGGSGMDLQMLWVRRLDANQARPTAACRAKNGNDIVRFLECGLVEHAHRILTDRGR